MEGQGAGAAMSTEEWRFGVPGCEKTLDPHTEVKVFAALAVAATRGLWGSGSHGVPPGGSWGAQREGGPSPYKRL